MCICVTVVQFILVHFSAVQCSSAFRCQVLQHKHTKRARLCAHPPTHMCVGMCVGISSNKVRFKEGNFLSVCKYNDVVSQRVRRPLGRSVGRSVVRSVGRLVVLEYCVDLAGSLLS